MNISEYTVFNPHATLSDKEVVILAGKEISLLVKSDKDLQVATTITRNKKNQQEKVGFRLYFNRIIFDICLTSFSENDILYIEEQVKNLANKVIELDKEYYSARKFNYTSSIQRIVIKGIVKVPVFSITTLQQFNHVMKIVTTKQEDLQLHELIGHNVEQLFHSLLQIKVIQNSMSSSDPIIDAFKYMEEKEQLLLELYSRFYNTLTPERVLYEYYKNLRGE